MKEQVIRLLRWSERYTKTDMVYIAKNGGWIVAGRGALFLASFMIVLAFSHLASKDTYGTYQYFISILGIVSIVSLPGIDIALVRSIALGSDGTYRYATKIRFFWSLLGTLCFFILAGWYTYHANFSFAWIALGIGTLFPFVQAFDAFEYFWNGRKNFKKSMFYTGLTFLIPAFVLVATLFITKELFPIITVFLLTTALTRILFTLRAMKEVANNDIDYQIKGLGKNLTLVQGIDIAVGYVDKIFLWLYTTPIAVAIYSFAQMPVSKAQLLTPIQMLALPKLSGKNIRDHKGAILKKFFKLFLFITPLVIVLAFCIPILFRLFFPQYTDSLLYLRFLLLTLLLMPFTLLHSALIAELKKMQISIIQIASLIARIILFFILIPSLQIWGAVYAVLASEMIKAVLIFVFFMRL